MNLARRDFLRISMATAGCIAAPPIAFSRSWPARPVRMVVPFGPGGTDVVFRLVGQKLSDLLGQQFYVENIAGAGGSIGTEHVKRAPSDGYTLLATAPAFVINPALHDKVPYER